MEQGIKCVDKHIKRFSREKDSLKIEKLFRALFCLNQKGVVTLEGFNGHEDFPIEWSNVHLTVVDKEKWIQEMMSLGQEISYLFRSNKKGKVGGLNTTYEIMHLAGLKPKRGGNRAGSLSQARLASDTQCKKKANVLLRNWEYTFDIESALTAQSKCNEKGASRKRKGARGISTEEPLPSTSAISGREVATDMDSHAGEDTVPFAKISKTSEMLSTTACNIDPCVKLEIEEKMKLESEDENCDSMEVAMEISTAVKQETPATNIVPRARVVIETANMDPDPPWPFEVELPVTPLPFCQDLSFWDGTEWASTGLIPSLTTSQMWLAQHQ